MRTLSGRTRLDMPGEKARVDVSYTSTYLRWHAREYRTQAARNKAFMVNMRQDRVVFISDFIPARARVHTHITLSVLVRYVESTIPVATEHGMPAAGRQCISAHYPKITIIL